MLEKAIRNMKKSIGKKTILKEACVLLTVVILFLSVIPVTANNPPETPTINGPTSGKSGTAHPYTFSTTDPDGDDVSYCVNWSDGTGEVCIGPFASGKEVTNTHIWSVEGTYTVKVKARDIYNAESDWATLTVTMPCSYNKPIPPFFELLFQQFSNAFPILRHLYGY
jgi:hypothetical protein